jgi:mitochondrial distribution and morphology protein 12
MSVDISWATISQGDDGDALAEKIRDFIHEKFQQVPLPRFIKSVQVHSFEFGSACPDVEIKDISDPLPDFYDEGSDESDTSSNDPHDHTSTEPSQPTNATYQRLQQVTDHQTPLPTPVASTRGLELQPRLNHENLSAIPRSTTPGIPGGTSNFSYFHMPIGGLSGAQTPLAAMASGAPFSPIGWPMDRPHSPMLGPGADVQHNLRYETTTNNNNNNDPSTRPSTANTLLTSPDQASHGYTLPEKVTDDPSAERPATPTPASTYTVSPSDMQVVARVKYEGDIQMVLTAEILLDYPMPSFVGIPLKLSITGMSFDGVAILAYIKKRMHFCFLDPDDAETLVGDHVTADDLYSTHKDRVRALSVNAGLLKDIHIESEIGRQESGKQVLKNVGKVEKFVLEQVRRIFEDEFVFPSFWTFLV